MVCYSFFKTYLSSYKFAKKAMEMWRGSSAKRARVVSTCCLRVKNTKIAFRGPLCATHAVVLIRFS